MRVMIYTIIEKRIAECLKPLHAYIYLGLCLHTDFNTNESNVNEETLATFLNCDRHTVGRAIAEFAKQGLIEIKKEQHGWREKNRYTLKRDNWFGVKKDILDEDMTREEIGFLLLLKSICWNHKNYTEYYGENLEDVLVLGKSMIKKYLKTLEDKGFIKRDRKKKRITILRADLFIETEESEVEWLKGFYPEIICDDDVNDNGNTTLQIPDRENACQKRKETT